MTIIHLNSNGILSPKAFAIANVVVALVLPVCKFHHHSLLVTEIHGPDTI